MSESRREHIEGAKKQSAAFDEGIEEKGDKKKGPEAHTDEHMDKIDRALGELIDIVARGPEAKKEALRIAIEQMRMIGEQMRQIRDMRNLNELKREMIKQWKELEKAAGGDRELLEQIQDWGKRFVEEKVIYYDLIGDIKNEVIEKSQDIQEKWNKFNALMGRFGFSFSLEIKYDLQPFLADPGTYFDLFINSLNKPTTGFEETFDEKALQGALAGITTVIQRANARAFSSSKLDIQYSDIDRDRGHLKEAAGELEQVGNEISATVKDIMKSFIIIKKIRDTHFLPLYNERKSMGDGSDVEKAA